MSAPRTRAAMYAYYGIDPDARRPTDEAAEQAARDRLARMTRAASDHRSRSLGLPTEGQMARATAAFGCHFARLFFGQGVMPGSRNSTEAALDRSNAEKPA
ncbi:MAG TPA: hypothetical protein VN018_07880 [Brevundimonas sp.]|nr:hypothetical protein [Brevundimonas sp.]